MQHNVILGLMTNDWPEKIFFLRPITIKSPRFSLHKR